MEGTNFPSGKVDLCCNKNYQQNSDEKLKEWFLNTYTFSNHNIYKFILLVGKGVYPYEYVDDWEKFIEVSVPKKEGFHSHLNIEDITDADYKHAKKVCKDFEIKHLGEYHDLYLQSDTLLPAEICVLNYMNLILLVSSGSWISIASSFKKH